MENYLEQQELDLTVTKKHINFNGRTEHQLGDGQVTYTEGIDPSTTIVDPINNSHGVLDLNETYVFCSGNATNEDSCSTTLNTNE